MLLMSCKINLSLLPFFLCSPCSHQYYFALTCPTTHFPGGHSLSCCVLSESSYYNRKRLLFVRRLQTERQKTARNKWEREEKGKNFRKPTARNKDLVFVAPIFFLVCNVATMMVTEYTALQCKQCLRRNFFQICVSDVFLVNRASSRRISENFYHYYLTTMVI